MGGIRALRELGRGAHRRGGREARARGLRDRRDLHARSQPRPRDLLDPRRAGDLLGRRAVRAVGRPHRSPRRGLADAARVDPRPGRRPARGDGRLPRPHGRHEPRGREGAQPVPRRARVEPLKPPRENRYRTAWAGDLRADRVGEEMRVAGWVHRRRDHGGLIFIDVRDRSGLLQLVFHPEDAAEAHSNAGRLRSEDVITVSGKLVHREEGTVNPKLPTGEVELSVGELEILADAETPPFSVDDDKPVDEATRLRYRYIDLRRRQMQDNIELRHRVAQTIRGYFNERDFLEIETPMMTRSTPEGARDFVVPSRLQRGSFYALPQSPQLFKQLFMIAGYERYYQIVRCFRDEDLRADRQPEFTQLDVELSFVEEEDVMALVDGLMKEVLALVGIQVELPLERVPYDEAMLRYGSDRPDRRIGRDIHDLGGAFAQSEFKVFSSALESGGVVRGLKTGGGEFPRKRFDDLTERAKSMGAKGLVWAVVEGDGWRSPIAKFLSDDEI